MYTPGLVPVGYSAQFTHEELTKVSNFLKLPKFDRIEYNKTLTFGVGNNNNLIIDSSGKVGIGVTPTYKLHVENASVNETIARFTNGTTSVDAFCGAAYSCIGGTGAVNSIRFDDTNNALALSTNNAIVLTVNSSGMVGIGVSPSWPLSIFYANRDQWVSRFSNTDAMSPYGSIVEFSNAAPNNNVNTFILCLDNVTTRFQLYSNGGIANYQANDLNISDERTKTNIQDAPTYLDKLCQIPVHTFLYKDQTDSDLNLGVIAQEVEAVCPEFINNDGWGETPADGVPLKSIYQTDMTFAYLKAIQELKAKTDALEAAEAKYNNLVALLVTQGTITQAQADQL